MKIAILHFYSGLASRGTETFVHELANTLADKNQIIVFQAGEPLKKARYQTSKIGAFAYREDTSFLRTTHILKRLFLDPVKLKQLLFTLICLPGLLHFKPDIIYPTDSGWQALICSIFARLTGAKLVISGHSGPGWDDRWNLLIKPHLFIAFTHHQLRWAKKTTLWRQQFCVIPSGVDLSRFKPARRFGGRAGKKVKLGLEKPIILMVAASTPAKRVEQGIRAIAGLPTGSLLLLGTGPLDERVNKLGYGLLGKKRFFHTTASQVRIPDYYRSADIFTLCSDSSEAFGTAYLEAMATGLPIVATDDESRRQILGDAGVFVKNPDDVREYSKALRTALEINWENLPREQSLKYSWEGVAEKYEDVLDKLAKK
jgi:glycosyltransferase involved in cell wall biosynthesis